MNVRSTPARGARPRMLALAVLLALGGGIASPAVAGFAAVPGTTDNGAVSEDDGTVSASVTGFGPEVVTSSDTLRVTVMIENSMTETAEDVELSIAMTASPFESRHDLSRFLDNPDSADTVTVADRLVGTEVEMWTEEHDHGDEEEFETVLLPGGDSTTESVPVRIDASPLSDHEDSWGVFGLAVILDDGNTRTVVDTLAFTWADAEITSIPVAIVATASGTSQRVDALLTAAGHPDVAIVVDPADVSPNAEGELDLSSREVYRLPAFNPDVTTLAHAEDRFLLDFALDRSSRDAPVFLQGAPWLGMVASWDEPTLSMLHDTGAVAAMVDPRFDAAAVDVGSVEGTFPPPVANVRRGSSSGTVPLIVPDAGLSELLATFRTGHPGTPSRLVAEVALIAADNPEGVPVVISPGPSWVIDGSQVSPSIEAIFAAPFVDPSSLAAVLSHSGRPTITGTRLAAADTDLPPENVLGLSQRLERLTILAETVEDSEALVDMYSGGILRVVALDARLDTDDRAEAAAGMMATLDDTLESVSITSGSALNLVAAAGDVPITVRNTLDVDSTVRVVMDSRAPELNVTEDPVVIIPANSTMTVGVPVTAVSSANVTVVVTLETESGQVISPVQELDIRVRADWGNAVTAVFTGGLVLLLIAGLVRTIRRGRKDTRTGPAEALALEEAEQAGQADD